MNVPAHTLTADFRRSGKTQQDYCTEKKISIHTLRYYLYKKPRRKFFRTPRHQQSNPTASVVPSFISFNREALPENTSRHPVTVIHGFFSVAELAEILSMASMRQ
jgi:hypothetical protein